jgi:hypothetical protein
MARPYHSVFGVGCCPQDGQLQEAARRGQGRVKGRFGHIVPNCSDEGVCADSRVLLGRGLALEETRSPVFGLDVGDQNQTQDFKT